MSEHFDLAVVGAGIVGLGAAWAARRRGLNVLVLERNAKPLGASIRNFGMLWPIGQPSGTLRETAERSLGLWRQLADEAQLWFERCGSLHVAHQADEWQVLQAFVDGPDAPAGVELLSRDETLSRSRFVSPKGLQGSMWSPHECRVAPRQAIPQVAEYLADAGVAVHWNQSVQHIDQGRLLTAAGGQWRAERVLVCSGADYQYLFPFAYAAADLRSCKLHMLRTPALASSSGEAALGPHLASGLTLRHYQAFQHCDGIEQLRARVAQQTPELDQYGIHVMLSQDHHGRLVLGDSHQYDQDIDPFDEAAIDQLILREMRRVYQLPDWQIDARWTGVYAKCSSAAWWETSVTDNVRVLNGFGGAGMTLSLAVADEVIDAWISSGSR